MRFSTLTTSLVASLFLSISLVEAAPFDPGAWCQILPQPCFLPPTGCQYCGSWDGHDAVLDCTNHGLVKICGGLCRSAPGPFINC
ncbi:hypothetical protein BGZ57DRAFT_930921 [Hyaloscypha finlandica]|nr:hypothetical protein BGZ57DRAFT_930921 [Hyaloscypha finlandica]